LGFKIRRFPGFVGCG